MIAVIIGICVALAITAVAVVRLNGSWRDPVTTGRALRWFAIAATVGVAVALLPPTLSDSGGATVYLLGVPLVAAAAVAVADVTGRATVLVTAVAAVVVLAWGLLLGLGYGAYFLLPALVLVAAVLAAPRNRPASSRR